MDVLGRHFEKDIVPVAGICDRFFRMVRGYERNAGSKAPVGNGDAASG